MNKIIFNIPYLTSGIVKLSDFIVSMVSDESLETILHFNTAKGKNYLIRLSLLDVT